MKRWMWISSAGIVGLAAVLILGPFLIKWLWAWTIPDLLPGAVQEGLVAAHITWRTAFKLALFIAVLVGAARGGGQ